YAMVRHGRLDVPVIGVANASWDLARLREYARESVREHGNVDQRVFERLASLLHYVDGDYRERQTFVAIARELAGAQRPL
ncbi:hypothetical protein ABTK17_20445, partial [Acinetobacter baumannii]